MSIQLKTWTSKMRTHNLSVLSLCLLISAFFVTESNAQGPADQVLVSSVNNGSCWIGPFEDDLMKMVNFSSSTQGMLHRESLSHIEEFVSMTLHEKGVAVVDGKSEFLLHCSGARLSLVHNYEIGHARICTWLSIDGMDLEVSRMGVEPVAHHGHCSGAVFGQAIVTLASGASESALYKALNELELGDYTLSRIVAGVYRLSLEESSHTFEENLLGQIEGELKKQNLVRSVELNYYQHEVGEFFQLND
jgi:hypothetical protein